MEDLKEKYNKLYLNEVDKIKKSNLSIEEKKQRARKAKQYFSEKYKMEKYRSDLENEKEKSLDQIIEKLNEVPKQSPTSQLNLDTFSTMELGAKKEQEKSRVAEETPVKPEKVIEKSEQELSKKELKIKKKNEKKNKESKEKDSKPFNVTDVLLILVLIVLIIGVCSTSYYLFFFAN